MPRPLDFDRLKYFEPLAEGPSQSRAAKNSATTALDRWPSREPVADGQISIKGSLDTIRRFKAMCKEDRRTYIDMLGILMDQFEGKK